MDLEQRLAQRREAEAEATDLAEAEQKKNEELYEERRKELLDIQQASCDQFDKTVLTLSTGLLAFSVAFLKDIVRLPDVVALPWLIGSWGALGGSVFTTFLSFLFSQRAADSEIQASERYYRHGQKDAFNKPNRWNQATYVCNHVTATLFVVGVGLMIYVVSVNTLKEAERLKNERRMKERPPVSQPQKDSQTGRTLPPRPLPPSKPAPTPPASPPSKPSKR